MLMPKSSKLNTIYNIAKFRYILSLAAVPAFKAINDESSPLNGWQLY